MLGYVPWKGDGDASENFRYSIANELAASSSMGIPAVLAAIS